MGLGGGLKPRKFLKVIDDRSVSPTLNNSLCYRSHPMMRLSQQRQKGEPQGTSTFSASTSSIRAEQILGRPQRCRRPES